MTAKEIAARLRNKGFGVEVSPGFVFVSLHRPVSTLEVAVALNHSIEQEFIGKSGDKVVVLGQE